MRRLKKRTAARTAWEMQDDFLSAFMLCGDVLTAARKTGISAQRVFGWLRRNTDGFIERYQRAEEIAGAVLESEAFRRAVRGVPRHKFFKGELITVWVDKRTGQTAAIDDQTGRGNPDQYELRPYVEHEFSDTLLLKLLQARMPDKYKDRSAVEVAGDVFDRMTEAELEEEEQRLGLTQPKGWTLPHLQQPQRN